MSITDVLSGAQPWEIVTADVLAGLAMLPDESVHCVVTSPPYHGLRNYGVEGQIGLEPTPWEWVEKMAAVMHEVKRVLRPDGTLFLNCGDSYSGSDRGQMRDGQHANNPNDKQATNKGTTTAHDLPVFGRDGAYPAKCLIGQPWRLAFAMIDDGWVLRSDIIFAKPAPMPESVVDRPTRSHEFIFLFAKSGRYFYDQAAIAEPVAWPDGPWASRNPRPGVDTHGGNQAGLQTRNARDVWTIGPEPFSEAHFATFPPALPEKCIKAGTSERGCCSVCGAPWRRIVEREALPDDIKAQFEAARERSGADHGRTDGFTTRKPNYERAVLGERWEPTCSHEAPVVPCLVLDPFSGAGTTVLVARRLGRRGLGIELNPEYADMARRRISEDMPMMNRLTEEQHTNTQLSLMEAS